MCSQNVGKCMYIVFWRLGTNVYSDMDYEDWIHDSRILQ